MPTKKNPIHIVVYQPKTKEGKRELVERIASVHASMVDEYIHRLRCSSGQKEKLTEEVLKVASQSRKR